MRIAVFGLGYVGCVTAACFARQGHDVIGVDVNDAKVEMINAGKSPIVEKGLEHLLQEIRESNEPGSLIATTDAVHAIGSSDLSMLCVGTPSHRNGNLSLDFVKSCARDIGTGIKDIQHYHVVVVRSTMLPGSVEDVVVAEIESASAKVAGKDFGVAMNPEFLRESTSIEDFHNPPVTVIGEYDRKSGDVLAQVYEFLSAPLMRTDIRTAEMVKYASNCFHALKVSFANEMGMLCKGFGVDSHAVMDIFCMDKKLNLSSYYLKPGFAFGGSCLPKDVRALTYSAKEMDLDLPVLSSVLPSNRIHVERVVEGIVHSGKKRIGILGLSFKAGTDDLRESPIVTLTESLIGKGFDVRIYDRNVSIAKLFGANKEYIEKQIPHISSLMEESFEAVVAHGDMIVVANKSEEFSEAVSELPDGKMVYDLVGIVDGAGKLPKLYEGVCW